MRLIQFLVSIALFLQGITIVNDIDDDDIEKILIDSKTPQINKTTTTNQNVTESDSVTNQIESANKPTRLFQSSEKEQPNIKVRKIRQCKLCGDVGHDRRTCPLLHNEGKFNQCSRAKGR